MQAHRLALFWAHNKTVARQKRPTKPKVGGENNIPHCPWPPPQEKRMPAGGGGGFAQGIGGRLCRRRHSRASRNYVGPVREGRRKKDGSCCAPALLGVKRSHNKLAAHQHSLDRKTVRFPKNSSGLRWRTAPAGEEGVGQARNPSSIIIHSAAFAQHHRANWGGTQFRCSLRIAMPRPIF